MDRARELRLTVWLRAWVPNEEREATRRDFTYADVTERSRMAFDPPTPAIAAFDPATGIIRATAPGQRTVTVTVLGSNNQPLIHTHLPTTLTVHATLDDWWLGNQTLTVPRTGGMEHAQISVHALFDAPQGGAPGIGTITDITGHGYVDLAPADATVARLDDRRRGRIAGLKVGSTRVTGNFLGNAESVDVHVVNRYAELPGEPVQPRAALDRVVFKGPPSTKANVLFVGEGFAAADKPLFDKAIREIAVLRMFKLKPRHSPFPQLADDFNVWSLFDASRQRGITYGPRVSTPAIAGNAPLILQAIDSAYGLYKPWRHEDDSYRPSTPPSLFGIGLRGDPRRFPREMTWVRALSYQIASLADPLVPSTDPEHHVGRHWRNGGKDYGLVCILVNEGGFRAENLAAFVTIDLSHEVRWTFERENPGPREHRWKVRRTDAAKVVRTQAEAFGNAADIAVHELAHSLMLGDEYEGAAGEARWRLVDGMVSDPPMIFDNLATPTDVHAGPPGFDIAQRVEIDPTRIKWGSLHRIEKSDRIREAVWNIPHVNAMEVTLTLDHNPTAHWGRVQKANRDVFIRELLWIREQYPIGEDEYLPASARPLQLPRGTEPAPTVIAGARIKQIRAAQRQLVLSVPQAALPPSMRGMEVDELQTLLPLVFIPGSVVYVPKRAAGVPLVLIDSAVAAWMAASHDPLSSNYQAGAGCDPGAGGPSHDSAAPDFPPKAAAGAGRSLPPHSFEVIGLYEGGGHYSCRTYRPAGFCKMRNQHAQKTTPPGKKAEVELAPELCYVCKYLIANRVNPRRLEEIERDYPEIKKRRP